MFNRGKTNQERSKEIDQNRTSSCFRDPDGNGLCLYRKERKREGKVGTESSLSYSLHRISAERHPRSLL